MQNKKDEKKMAGNENDAIDGVHTLNAQIRF